MPDLLNLNWVAVGLSAVAAFILGWLWFGPLFGKPWQAGMAMSDADMASGNTPQILGCAFALNVVVAVGLASFRASHAIEAVGSSLGFGAGLAMTFAAPVLAINALFGQRDKVVLAIDASYFVVMFALMGAVQALVD